MPDFAIVDSHVHLYDVGKLTYGWMKSQPKLNRTYDLSDFDKARGSVAVDKIVFAEVWVDPGLYLQEATHIQGLADKDNRLAGMVAHLPVERGAAIEQDLETLKQHKTLRGIRRLMEIELNQSFALEPGFIEGVKLVGRHGLPFDICVKHWGMVFALELVRRCPDVQFVLDHIGKPGIKHGLWEPWKSQIRDLAKLPNVTVKVSGVITEADHQSWKREQVIPYVEHVLDCFGFDRAMYGSDWTVSELSHPYPEWVAILDAVTKRCSDTEKRKLFRDTAIRVYRL